MEWETLKLSGTGPVRHLVLNRPRQRNAVNRQMLRDLLAACAAIEELPDLRCVILRGEGPSFCAGADLKEGRAAPPDVAATMQRPRMAALALQALTDLAPITIAAVQGHAIGGGCSLACACDFRIGAESASVAVREISLGFILSWRSLPTLVHLVGAAHAREMVLFGEPHDAATLARWGFFDRVVAEGELLAAAEALAAKVARQPPIPVRLTKQSINAVVKGLDRAVFHADPAAYALSRRSHAAETAREAFFSGKPRDWAHE